MLFLVFADRHMRGPIGENVRRHQRWIGIEPDRRVLTVLAGLLLELGHPVEPAKACDAIEHPGELRMLRHAGLVEQDRTLGGDARGNQACRDLAGALAKLLRVLRHGDGMQVDDAVDGFKIILQRHPVPDRTKIVAEMQIACRLDTRKDPLFRHGKKACHGRAPWSVLSL